MMPILVGLIPSNCWLWTRKIFRPQMNRRQAMRTNLSWIFRKLLMGFCVFGLVAIASPLLAGQFSDLSEEQQQLLNQYANTWDMLAPEKQQRLQKGVERWQQMTPQQRTQAQQRLQQWLQQQRQQRRPLWLVFRQRLRLRLQSWRRHGL